MGKNEILKKIISDQNLLKVLEHMQIAKVDYAKNIHKYTEIPMDAVKNALKFLLTLDAIEIYRNTSIKRTDAKLKKSNEVHKHHTYYSITREGTLILNEITPKVYLEFIDPQSLRIFINRDSVPSGYAMIDELLRFGIIDKKGKLTSTGKTVFAEGVRIGIIKR